MQKIGLFFGSYNPIHNGHLILANHFVEHTDIEQLWFVITPKSPFKQKQSMLPNHHRLELVYRATHEYPKLYPSDIEFKLPTPNYTSDTLAHLEEKYPKKTFVLLMGEDNLANFHKWKNHEVILECYALYVYPRKEANPIPEKIQKHPNIKIVEAPQIQLSSSSIRKWIKEGKNIRPLIPPESWVYLDEMNFYK
ncbi:nicotinate (nicotinamide) nucleotide adenylyltransferase [Flavobacteriaceae bacterium]|nr:nicotinate (nicotinamide) nucleotide adenylyltransferase [Flavobacteriaceae bacterium]